MAALRKIHRWGEMAFAARSPYAVEVEAGRTYFWCACGRSHREPFCDGRHAGTDKRPKAFQVEQAGTVNLCRCKQTSTPPFCDGGHNRS